MSSRHLPLSSRQLLLQPALLPYFVLTLLSYGAVQLYFTYFNVWLVERLAWGSGAAGAGRRNGERAHDTGILAGLPPGSPLARQQSGGGRSSGDGGGHADVSCCPATGGAGTHLYPHRHRHEPGELATSVAVSNRSHAEQ